MTVICAQDVANYFLYLDYLNDAADGISNSKLQKLLYYAYGFYYALHGEALFQDTLEAWRHGPVVPSLYRNYHGYGKNLIPFNPDTSIPTVFSEEQEDFLRDIYWEFAQYAAWKLTAMTHEEAPWQDSRKDASVAIAPLTLKQYFSQRVAANG